MEEGQRRAWSLVRQSIDEGRPCYGWELDMPEYYVVYGCDDTGYYFSGPGCEDGKGPKPWRRLGDIGMGVREMYRVRKGSAVGDAQVLMEAPSFAILHATDTGKWVFANYSAGLSGYEAWMGGLCNGRADAMGMVYNAAVWKECRGYVVQFLQEARDRLGGSAAGLLTEAAKHYQVVFDHLTAVAMLHPFHGMDPEHLSEEGRVQEAAEALQRAREAEAEGLGSLRSIVAVL